jgi:molybdate transport system regulatory protein
MVSSLRQSLAKETGRRARSAPSMAHLSIRIDFEPSGSALGPGMAELLERISRFGAIRKAAASMDMSYRKAWVLLQGMHKTFGAPVVATETGGNAGGGTQLTELGNRLLKAYRAIQQSASRIADDEMQLLSAMVQKNAPPRSKPKTGRAHRAMMAHSAR